MLWCVCSQKPENKDPTKKHFSLIFLRFYLASPHHVDLLCLCVCVDDFYMDVCVCFVPQDSYSSQCVSQPPTPSPMSPSSASLSSCHGEDSDSISSPAWPKTPTSPVSAAKHSNSFLFHFCVFLTSVRVLRCVNVKSCNEMFFSDGSDHNHDPLVLWSSEPSTP